MIIGIDGLEANAAGRVGVGRYALEILRGMYPIVNGSDAFGSVTIRIYLPREPSGDMPPESGRWQYRIVPVRPLWTFIGLPLAIATERLKPDVFFSPTHYIPRFTAVPRVCSVMDVSYESFPEMFRSADLYKLKNWTRYAARHTSHVITISTYSRNAIMDAYGTAQNRVSVTYPGQSLNPGALVMDKSALMEKYGIGGNYLLAVGTIQPRKNYSRMIEAYSLFLRKNWQKFSELQLVIVGKRGWMYEDILFAPARFGVSDQVKFLDFVDDSDLGAIYTHALAFIMPSLYEGFGLPVLEAMAYGVPVVVSSATSLPEIAGIAGIYVDPESVQSITDGMLRAVRERNLIQGKARISAGKRRAAEFTWEKAARQTLEILKDVAERNRSGLDKATV